MKLTRWFFFSLLLSPVAGILPAPSAGVPLDPRHREWLDEDVRFLISQEERKLFLELASHRERDTFMEEFWRRRDPTPETARNERLEEHRLRLAYANDLFTLNKSLPGSLTDRGRMVIQLGLPSSRDSFDHRSQLFPTELWLYTGVTEPFLPESFYLIFFRPGGFGEFRLWNPVGDGPSALIADNEPNRYLLDSQAAYDFFKRIDRELALAVLRLVPGEDAQTNLESQELVSKVQAYADLKSDSLPRREVTTSYSFQILDAESTAAIWLEPNGLASLHYALEVPAERLGWETRGEELTSSFRLQCTILDRQGRTFDSFQDELDVVVSRREYEEGGRRRLQFQGKLFLIPGDFEVLFDLRNNTSKRNSYLRHSVHVPEFFKPGEMGSPILTEAPLHQGSVAGKPFAVESTLIVPAMPGSLHSRVGNRVLVPVYLPAGRPEMEIGWTLLKEAEQVWSDQSRITAADSAQQLVAMDLPELKAGSYRLRVQAGSEVRFVEFSVAPRLEVPGVRVITRESPMADDPNLLRALAGASARSGDFETAARLLERAGNPEQAAAMRARIQP